MAKVFTSEDGSVSVMRELSTHRKIKYPGGNTCANRRISSIADVFRNLLQISLPSLNSATYKHRCANAYKTSDSSSDNKNILSF